MTPQQQHVLVGKTITAVFLADDKQAIKFDIKGNPPIIARADGDCCSHSWIENVENHEAVIGSPVLEACEIPMPRKPEDRDGELIQFYGFKITTLKGTCTIDYRNESNGYYGGSLVWPPDEYYYGGVFKQNVSKEVWKQLV